MKNTYFATLLEAFQGRSFQSSSVRVLLEQFNAKLEALREENKELGVLRESLSVARKGRDYWHEVATNCLVEAKGLDVKVAQLKAEIKELQEQNYNQYVSIGHYQEQDALQAIPSKGGSGTIETSEVP